MKPLGLIVFLLLLTGCIVAPYPEGTYIEPLPSAVVIGPPVIVPSPPSIHISPIPPVVIVPDRSLYFYGGLYYYRWGGRWFYSQRDRGPWHDLPGRYYPREHHGHSDRDQHDYGHGRGHGDRD